MYFAELSRKGYICTQNDMHEEFKCIDMTFIMKINTILKAEVMQDFNLWPLQVE